MYRGAIMTVVAFLLVFKTTRDAMILTVTWIIAYFYETCVCRCLRQLLSRDNAYGAWRC
jgi:hypothetical protein